MKMFIVLLIATGLQLVSVGQNVVQVEYFLDTDAGVGKNTLVNVPPSSDGSFPLLLNVSSAATGYHQLYLRTKDNNGAWSLTTRKLVEVVPSVTLKNTVGGEYFFDQDPGVGQALVLTISAQDSVVLQNFAATVSGLAPGVHKLYTRLKDSYGGWSQTSRTNVDIVPVDTRNNVVSGEYFFDYDPGFGAATVTAVSPKDSAIQQSLTAAVTSLAPGYHVLYGRWKDSSGRWSQTLRRLVEVVKSTDTDYIVSLEYFFKKDSGFGNNHTVQLSVPTQNGIFSFTIPLQYIPVVTSTDSLFKLFIRTKDSSTAHWSITQYKDSIQGLPDAPLPLPLTFISFNAVKQEHTVLLHWQTTNEVNTGYFNIQRSSDGTGFTTIGKADARGNSTLQSSYTYTDDIDGIRTNKLYYRLQEIDKDGKIIYSDVASVNLEPENAPFMIMPNPASSYITVILGSGINPANAIIMVTDLAGHTLIKQKMISTGGQRIAISSFPKGVYTVSIVTPGSVQTQKLLIK